MLTDVYRAETNKPIATFIGDLGRSMAMQGFIIHNEDRMEMVHHFGHHGVELAEDFDLHLVQVCSPKKSARSLVENIERAVLMPRSIVVFSVEGRTQIRMLRMGRELVAQLVEDAAFPDLNQEVTVSLVAAIKEAL